jgi:predicted dehydrogenase
LPFIKAGIPTYIEKPITISLADARKIERAAKKSGGIVFVGHIHIYNPAYQVAKKYAQKAGTLRYLLFEGMNNGPFRDDTSAMWDWAPHDVYLAIDLMGDLLPTHVQAWGIKTLRPQTSLYDFSVIKMTFPDGLTAISTTSWLAPEKRKKVTIVGEKDSIVFDDITEKKVAVYQNMGPRIVSPDKGRIGGVLRQEPKISYPKYSRKSPLQAELEAFISAIQTSEQPVTGLEKGVAVVRVLAAAEKSMNLDGKRVKV